MIPLQPHSFRLERMCLHLLSVTLGPCAAKAQPTCGWRSTQSGCSFCKPYFLPHSPGAPKACVPTMHRLPKHTHGSCCPSPVFCPHISVAFCLFSNARQGPDWLTQPTSLPFDGPTTTSPMRSVPLPKLLLLKYSLSILGYRIELL